jgi:CubicO group peptidase (beta-lactamase class C family)
MRNRQFRVLGSTVLLFAAGCSGAVGATSTVAVPEPTPTDMVMLHTASPGAVRLDRYLGALEALGFSGAIVVEHEGQVVLQRGYGLADREARRPYTPSTVQTMGSITKQITGAAILLLAGRGELSIDARIGDYLPGVPADKQPITLHHLLTHQSGLPEYSGSDAEPLDTDAFLARVLQLPLDFAPGAGLEYSNAGYSLLGVIIERVSGRGYEQFIREDLLLPAGLGHTGYVLPPRPDGVMAAGYRDGERYEGSGDESNWLPDGPGWNLRANGGLRTTAEDMHRWLAVLRGSGPLAPDLVARWTDTHVAASEEFGIGYGWVIHTSELGRMIMHAGGNPAFSSVFAWLPAQQLFLYAQANSSKWEIGELQESLLRLWFDAEFLLPPAVTGDAAASPARTRERAGRYVTGGGSVEFLADDIRLQAILSGQIVFDAMLSHDEAQQARLAHFNRNAALVIERLMTAPESALDGLVSAGTDHVARARSLAQLVTRRGTPRSLSLVGSMDNVPGSRFVEHGGSVSFVRADYEGDGARIIALLWREDGTYRGATMGPLTDVPTFILVPVAGDAYTAVERDAPWRTQRVVFDGACALVGEARLCRM